MRMKLENLVPEVTSCLDEQLKSDALFIADQLIKREGINEKQALQVAVALVKRKPGFCNNDRVH